MPRPLTVWTDGSVTPKGAAWATIDENGVLNSGRIKTKDTYIAELCAVVEYAERSEGEFCVVCDLWCLVKEIRDMLDNPAWEPKEHGKELWERLDACRDKIKGIEWQRRCSSHQARLVDHEAYRRANER